MRPASSLWINCLTLVLLLAAGLALRLSHLTLKPYWFDECFSVELARLDWSNFLHVLWWREANMTLYYLLLRAWLLFGQGEFFIRSLSAFISAATIPAIYWLGKLLFNSRVALIAAALFTFNAYEVRYAQEARSYALFVLLATLSSGFLVSWLKAPSSRLRLCWIMASILAVYAHLYALLLIIAQWLALRWFRSPSPKSDGRRNELRRGWQIIALSSLPLLIFVLKTGAGPIRWIHRPGIHDLLDFWRQFCGGSTSLAMIYTVACLSAAIPLWKRGLTGGNTSSVWSTRFLFLWLLFPIILTVALSFARPVFLPRYMIFCQPALFILVASAIAQIRPTWALAPVFAVILLFSLQRVFFVYSHDYDDQRDGLGAAAGFILDHQQPGDGIIFDIAEARVPYEFFRSERAGENTASPSFTRQFGPEILFPHEGTGLTYRDFKAKLTPALLTATAPAHARIWVVFIYNSNSDATTTVLNRALPQWFKNMQIWHFPRVEVRLYTKS